MFILLSCLVALLASKTHARHNITAALVALAPDPESDTETKLSADEKDAGSHLDLSWSLVAVSASVSFIVVLA